MNKLLKVILLVILALALLAAGCSPTLTQSAKVGSLAPDFQLYNLEENPVSLINFRGMPVLINFWATWCPPCRAEMPYLQKVYEEWSAKGLALLTINIGESSSQVSEFMESYNLSFPVLLDTRNSIAEKYNIRVIPTTFFPSGWERIGRAKKTSRSLFTNGIIIE